ncbi:MAG: winged helix-turn-helix transcriptional regulator [Thermoplasmatota archaeon]
MNRRRVLPAVLVGAFILATAGSLFSAYAILVNDPFLAEDAGEVVDNRSRDNPYHMPPDGAETQSTDSEGISGWVLGILGFALGASVLFLAGSGNIYLRSKRGENLVRADLLDLITINPGINLSSIRRELQLSQGAVSYHIMKLEKNGKIFSDKGSKERRYYPSSMGYRAAMRQALEDEVRSILSNDTSRTIVDMLKEGPMSQNELVNELNISPSTVHWHMERMKKAGMILKEQKGRSVYYELAEQIDINT